MTDDLIKKLSSLAQLDRDATSVYDEALKHAEDDDVKMKFKDFRDEHEYHVTTIAAAVERLGEPALDLKVDVLGHVADWVTAFRSMGGQQGALHAMRTAEKYHNGRYAEAVEWDVTTRSCRRCFGAFVTRRSATSSSSRSSSRLPPKPPHRPGRRPRCPTP